MVLTNRIDTDLDLSPDVIQHVIDYNPHKTNVYLNVHSKTLERHKPPLPATRDLCLEHSPTKDPVNLSQDLTLSLRSD